jgi:cytoskeletal protein CcmA (bactofilin family)
MFDRHKNKPAATSAPEPTAPAAQEPAASQPTPVSHTTARSAAMIGPSIKIKGEISGDEDLLIQGQVEGTISLKAHQVVVGESGQVSADILAKTIKIDGKVSGDITGTENVVISKLGNVCGNIIAPRVLLEDGAIFKGSIDMNPSDAAAKTAPQAAKEPTAFPPQDTKAPRLDLKSG